MSEPFDPALLFDAPAHKTSPRTDDPWAESTPNQPQAPSVETLAAQSSTPVVKVTRESGWVGALRPFAFAPLAILVVAQVISRFVDVSLSFPLPLPTAALAGAALVVAGHLAPQSHRVEVTIATCSLAAALTFPTMAPAIASLAAFALWAVRR